MDTKRIYINWKEPNPFQPRYDAGRNSRFRGSHHESWNLDRNAACLLNSPGSWRSSLTHSCSSHKSSSLGRPNPCHAPSLYYNTENRSSLCQKENLGLTQQNDILFVNNLFEEEPSNLPEGRGIQDAGHLYFSKDGKSSLPLEGACGRSNRSERGNGQQSTLPKLRRYPRPCLPAVGDAENYYEPVEHPGPSKTQRSAHSQYISVQRAMSMDAKPRIPPRHKLRPESRDSLRFNMFKHDGQEKGYDQKICLPEHLDDVSGSRILSGSLREENEEIILRKRRMMLAAKDCCRNYNDQSCLCEHSASCAHPENSYDLTSTNPESLQWDYTDGGPISRRNAEGRQCSSHRRFRSYLDDSDRDSILTTFSSTGGQFSRTTSVEAPAWFDELISSTFPPIQDTSLRRRSLSLGSLADVSQQKSKTVDAGSLHLENNIQRDRKVFWKTRVYSMIRSQLKRDGHILITGYPGAGKTALAYQVMRDFAADGTSAIVIDSPEAFPERIPAGNTILLIDDIFGVTKFEEAKIDLWKKVLKKLDDIWDERLKWMGASDKASFFLVSTTRSYILNEALRYLGKYSGTIFRKEYIVDLGAQALSNIEKMNMLDSHVMHKGHSLNLETKEEIIYCKTFAFPQLCQLYFAGFQNPETAILFFRQPMKFLVATLESLFLCEKRKFAGLLLLVLSNGTFNIAQLENNKNAADDLKAKFHLALKYGEVKEPFPTFTEMGQDLKFMIGSFITMDGDVASFLHPTMSDAIVFIVGERNSEFILKHSSMKFIFDRVRINQQLPNGTLTRPSEGDRSNFLLHLAPSHFKALAKRFTQEVASGHFSLVCAHEACSVAEFVEILYDFMKDKGLVSRPVRIQRKFGIHSSEKDHGGKFLYWTVWNRNEEMCKHFLQRCFFAKKEKSQAMIGCSLSGNVKALALLLEETEADGVTYQPGSTMPYLESQASKRKDDYIVQVLVLGSTPLHIASERGQLGIVKLLLAKGANVNKRGPRVAATSLHYACQGGFTDVVGHLIQAGADVNSLDWVARTPLHWAAAKGHSETVKFLTYNRCYLDAPDAEGLTPLHCAAWGGHLETCVSLLNAGASPKSRTRYNKTPLDISIDESFKKRFHDTIVFDFDVYVDDTGAAAWLVGLRGPLILSVSATSMMVKRPRNHEILFEWSLRTLRRFGHSYTSFRFEAGRNCETGEGVYNFVTTDAEDLMECVKMRLLFLEENNDMLFHRRAPPLH